MAWMHAFWVVMLAGCSADRSPSTVRSSSGECCSFESTAMDVGSDEESLVLLQKSAKTKLVHAIHNEDLMHVENTMLERARARLWSIVSHKMKSSAASRHYVIAQICILVVIAVVVLCFSCMRIFGVTSTSIPKERWLDFRAEGGVRHRVLEWSGRACKEASTPKEIAENCETNSEPVMKADSADPVQSSSSKWYNSPSQEKSPMADLVADSLTDSYADDKPILDGATPDTKFHPLNQKARNLDGPQVVPSKHAKLDSAPSCEDAKFVTPDRIVLFVHAASLCAGTWSPIVRRLKNVTAIAFDQRGHGDSDAPQGVADYRWETIGQDFLRIVESVTARYGRPPDACVAHSFAGDCILLALSKNPIPVGRLILLDPVLADADGASIGAKRLADATRVCGQRELAGFGSVDEVGEHLERMLAPQLARDGLDAEARESYSMYGSMLIGADRWQLKCSRQHEAAVYENRVPLAEHLAHHHVDADVHVVFAEKRRTAMSVSQDVAAARDRKVAERVLKVCQPGSSLHDLHGVGHFMVLEAPDLVAAKLEELLPRI